MDKVELHALTVPPGGTEVKLVGFVMASGHVWRWRTPTHRFLWYPTPVKLDPDLTVAGAQG